MSGENGFATDLVEQLVEKLDEVVESNAMRSSRERKELRNERHPSSDLLHHISYTPDAPIGDPEWQEQTKGDFAIITGYTVTLPKTTDPKCGYEPETELNLYDELDRVLHLNVKGCLRSAETRAALDGEGRQARGYETEDERADTWSIRNNRGRKIMRVVSLIGGRRYAIDPAYPLTSQHGGATVVRITQHGGSGTQAIRPFNGDFEWIPAESTLHPDTAKKIHPGEPGLWWPLSERTIMTKTRDGSKYGETIEYPETRPPEPQWNRPYTGHR